MSVTITESVWIPMYSAEMYNVNVLTVIANESYDSFAKRLQSRLPKLLPIDHEVTASLFAQVIRDVNGLNEQVIDHKFATKLTNNLIRNGYIDDDNSLTENT